jgi:hypothetical protein
LDATETKQDEKQTASSVTPSATAQPTPASPRTFTESEVEKIKSDALAQAGRDAKRLAEREKAAEAREKSASEAESRIQKEKDERELSELESAARDDPEEKPKLLDFKRKLADERRKQIERDRVITEREQKIADKEARLEALEFKEGLNDLALKYNVSVATLKDQVGEVKDMTVIEKIASLMPKSITPHEPDSGKTTGGGTSFTQEQVADYDFWKAHKDEIEQARAEGRIK